MKANLFLLFFFISVFTRAQLTFQRTYGGGGIDVGFSVQQTNDGGYALFGSSTSVDPSGNFGYYLIKANSSGVPILKWSFGDYEGAYSRSGQQTSDGGYIVAGQRLGLSVGSYDIYLIKSASNGNTQWAKTFGGTGWAWCNSVTQTSDGGYTLAGATTSYGAGNYDSYLIKTNAGGGVLWTKVFGGSDVEDVAAIQQTKDGGFIVAGNTASFGSGNRDIYLIKTNPQGDTLWTKAYGGTGDDRAMSIQQTSDGGYIVGGYTSSFGAGDKDFYLVKTDGNGDTLWSKSFGGPNTDLGNSVRQTSDGGYIFVGSTNSFGAGNNDVCVIKTDSTGSVLWNKAFGSGENESGNSVRQTIDGGYIIAGSSSGFSLNGDNDIYFIKTDTNGNSGCNQSNPSITAKSCATVVRGTATQIASGVVAGNIPPQSGPGGTTAILCSTAGIGQLPLESSLDIFPNPTSGIFTIIGENEKIVTVILYNVLGKKIRSFSGYPQSAFDITSEPDGFYFLEILTENGIIVKKIIKK